MVLASCVDLDWRTFFTTPNITCCKETSCQRTPHPRKGKRGDAFKESAVARNARPDSKFIHIKFHPWYGQQNRRHGAHSEAAPGPQMCTSLRKFHFCKQKFFLKNNFQNIFRNVIDESRRRPRNALKIVVWELCCWILFGGHPLKLERYRED